MPGQSFDNF